MAVHIQHYFPDTTGASAFADAWLRLPCFEKQFSRACHAFSAAFTIFFLSCDGCGFASDFFSGCGRLNCSLLNRCLCTERFGLGTDNDRENGNNK